MLLKIPFYGHHSDIFIVYNHLNELTNLYQFECATYVTKNEVKTTYLIFILKCGSNMYLNLVKDQITL